MHKAYKKCPDHLLYCVFVDTFSLNRLIQSTNHNKLADKKKVNITKRESSGFYEKHKKRKVKTFRVVDFL